jgi:hypothetical protein
MAEEAGRTCEDVQDTLTAAVLTRLMNAFMVALLVGLYVVAYARDQGR